MLIYYSCNYHHVITHSYMHIIRLSSLSPLTCDDYYLSVLSLVIIRKLTIRQANNDYEYTLSLSECKDLVVFSCGDENIPIHSVATVDDENEVVILGQITSKQRFVAKSRSCSMRIHWRLLCDGTDDGGLRI